MTVDELCNRFPEIPRSFRSEPFLADFAEGMGPLLQRASKPSNCAGNQYSADQLIYNKLIVPIDILNIGLTTPAKVIRELSGYLAAYQADPDAFMASVVPTGAPSKPGGCQS